MKKYVGKYPVERQNEKKCIGNPDCSIPSHCEGILKIVDPYVHAARAKYEISYINRDTIYIRPISGHARLDIIGKVDAKFDDDAPDSYDELVKNMTAPERGKNMFSYIGAFKNDIGDPFSAIELLVNNRFVGYYIPVINSWIVGDWTWHDHYIDIVLKYVWPQFVEKLQIKPIVNSVYAEVERPKPSQRIVCSVGADPEFEVMTKNGRVINAAARISTSNYLSDEIGLDGCQDVLEFRPKPGTPAKVTQNIRHLMKEFSEKWPNLDLGIKGDNFAAGGHIHVGIGKKINIPVELIEILDDFLGRPTINQSGSARGRYKSLHQYEPKSYGFEYRSTPASVFVDPTVCYISLKLAKNLCEKWFNGESIVYNDRPTLQDYIDVAGLTKREANTFITFCEKSCDELENSMRKSWKVKPASESRSCRVDVSFRDDWDQTIANAVSQSIGSIEFDEPYSITFYGLARERGSFMTTLQRDDGSRLGRNSAIIDTWQGDRSMSIGVSYDLRKIDFPMDELTHIKNVIERMIEENESDLLEDGDDTEDDDDDSRF